MNRRGFIARIAMAALGASLLALSSCREPDRESALADPADTGAAARLRAALALALGPGPSPARGAMPTEAAAALLLAGLPDREVDQLLADPAALRSHVAARADADLGAGRTDYVDGWLLAETEIAAAAVLAGDAAP
jgi:hypothetical protein